MPFVYCLAIFVSSGLLFLVQPMCAKALLPALGGTPAVWNTCMLFFQAGLLAGYAAAHALPRRLGLLCHALLHVAVLTLVFFTLPITFPGADVSTYPVVWLLLTLGQAALLPFVLVSSTGPLLQLWYARRYPTRDPYFLYAASNLGSFAALFSYPLLVEPNLRLGEQSELWRWGYLGLIALTALCVPGKSIAAPEPKLQSLPLTWKQRGLWIILALVPSSLLLSVTGHLTTDIAPIPLLWIVPLGLYLLTFTLVFARRPFISHAFVLRWLPLVVVVLVLVLLTEATDPLLLVLGLHLLGLVWIALACHGELARTRPEPAALTEFYLCLAVGGVLGGALCALIAPLVFPARIEYPLMLVLAVLLRGFTGSVLGERGLPSSPTPLPHGERGVMNWGDLLWPLVLGACTVQLLLLVRAVLPAELAGGKLGVIVCFAVPVVACYTMNERPLRFALGLALLLSVGGFAQGVHGEALYRERSFFGIHRVTQSGDLRRLVHGTTTHGQQSTKLFETHEPLTYYHRASPIGQVFTSLNEDTRLTRTGLVGLGAGSLASYSKPGQTWTFFEIDPAVIRIASDPRLFTFLDQARGRIDIVPGDARLQLARTDQKFGLLVVDAFGSDSIPLHLLTREALAIYLDRLDDDGLLVFHISNRALDLEPVLANLAADQSPPLRAYVQDQSPTPAERERGRWRSVWLLITRESSGLPARLQPPHWQPARTRPDLGVWTDDFSNILQVFRWDWLGSEE